MPGIHVTPGYDPGDFDPITGKRNRGRFGVGAQGGGANPHGGGIVFNRYVDGVDMWAGPAPSPEDERAMAAGYVRDPRVAGGWRYTGALECDLTPSGLIVEGRPHDSIEDAFAAMARCNERARAAKSGGDGKGCCCCCEEEAFTYSQPTQPPVMFTPSGQSATAGFGGSGHGGASPTASAWRDIATKR